MAYRDNWYLEILLGLFCGLRKGEIFALQFNDFNTDEHTLEINKQLVREGKVTSNPNCGYSIENYSLKTKNPKTQNSYRKLRIPKIILEELEIRKEYIEKIKNNKNFIDNGYISCQANGKPLTVHGLRHMFATILIEREVPIVKISGLLGHNSIHTTFEFYCEIMDENEKIKAFMNNNFIPKEESA